MAADPGDDGHVDGDGDCVAESITSVNCGFVRLLSHKKGGGTVLARTWNWAQKLKVRYWAQRIKIEKLAQKGTVQNWDQELSKQCIVSPDCSVLIFNKSTHILWCCVL